MLLLLLLLQYGQVIVLLLDQLLSIGQLFTESLVLVGLDALARRWNVRVVRALHIVSVLHRYELP